MPNLDNPGPLCPPAPAGSWIWRGCLVGLIEFTWPCQAVWCGQSDSVGGVTQEQDSRKPGCFPSSSASLSITTNHLAEWRLPRLCPPKRGSPSSGRTWLNFLTRRSSRILSRKGEILRSTGVSRIKNIELESHDSSSNMELLLTPYR